MKQTVKTALIFPAILILLGSCQALLPDLSGGDISERSISIPPALTAGNSQASITSRSVGESPEDVFEPFRASLRLAETALDAVDEIIRRINENFIPNEGTFDYNNGESVVISTSDARSLPKRIEWRTSAGQRYMQLNYQPGEVKGNIIYHEPEAADRQLDRIFISYDETGASPVLTVYANINNLDSSGQTEAQALYFEGTRNAEGQYEFEGGVAYHYVIPGNSDFEVPYEAEHVYMFKALGSPDGERSEVALYFPKADVIVSGNVNESMDIKSSYLDILFEWIEGVNPGDLDAILGQTAGTITSGSGLGSALDVAAANDPALVENNPDLFFVTGLDNNIAYTSSGGYESNGSEADSFLNGDPKGITFTLSPSAIAGLNTDSNRFAFLND